MDRKLSGLHVSSNEDSKFCKLDMKWIIVSFISALILSRFSKNSMCTYLFFSMSWLLLTILISQAYRKYERDHLAITATFAASLTGWIIGTTLLWKRKDFRGLFFE